VSGFLQLLFFFYARASDATNNGQSTQTLQLIDLKSGKEISSVVIPKAWLGLAFSGDEPMAKAFHHSPIQTDPIRSANARRLRR
jgi:hypothetical protein